MCVAGSGGATYSLHNPCQVARVRLRCRAHVRGGQREYAATATFAPTHLDTASRYGGVAPGGISSPGSSQEEESGGRQAAPEPQGRAAVPARDGTQAGSVICRGW